MNKRIEIGIKTKTGGIYKLVYSSDAQGRWTNETMACACQEDDVVDALRRHDRKQLTQHFPTRAVMGC